MAFAEQVSPKPTRKMLLYPTSPKKLRPFPVARKVAPQPFVASPHCSHGFLTVSMELSLGLFLEDLEDSACSRREWSLISAFGVWSCCKSILCTTNPQEQMLAAKQGRTASGNIEALMITYTILGVPYHNYGIMGPKTLFLLRPLDYSDGRSLLHCSPGSHGLW